MYLSRQGTRLGGEVIADWGEREGELGSIYARLVLGTLLHNQQGSGPGARIKVGPVIIQQ